MAATALQPVYRISQPIAVHADQRTKNPLYTALEIGAAFIEFDVHLRDGTLLVGHDETDLTSVKTIVTEYLNPIRELIDSGRIEGELNLLIDIKTNATESLQTLQFILSDYHEILSTSDERKLVKIIITGNRDKELIMKSPYCFLDGRLDDLDNDKLDSNKVPIISDHWKKVTTRINYYCSRFFRCSCCKKRRGQTLDTRIVDCLQKAQKLGVRFRIWAIPNEGEVIWGALDNMRTSFTDTYLFNTDYPEELALFLHGKA